MLLVISQTGSASTPPSSATLQQYVPIAARSSRWRTRSAQESPTAQGADSTTIGTSCRFTTGSRSWACRCRSGLCRGSSFRRSCAKSLTPYDPGALDEGRAASWRGRASGAAPLPVRAPGAPSGLDEARGRSPRPGAGPRAVKNLTPPWAPPDR